MKNQYIGEITWKEGAWTVCKFKGGLTKKSGCSFLGERRGGVDTPMHTMVISGILILFVRLVLENGWSCLMCDSYLHH